MSKNALQKYNVLLIDDHPLITEAYKSALFYLSSLNNDLEFSIHSAYNCDEAFELIKEIRGKKKESNLVFLDISLPPSLENNILSGEDLGVLIRKQIPKAKIIVVTSFSDNLRIQNIFKSINPEGFLIKNDITPKELVNAIDLILNNKSFYSETVMQVIRKQLTINITIDDIDRKLLYELSLGTRMIDLAEMLPLSLNGLEKRKQRLMDLFEVEVRNDRSLIINAREKGFI